MSNPKSGGTARFSPALTTQYNHDAMDKVNKLDVAQ